VSPDAEGVAEGIRRAKAGDLPNTYRHTVGNARMPNMPSTHVSLHYHAVFSTKNRYPFIANNWRPRLHEYLGGCVRGFGGVPLQIGGVADHVHLLVGLKAVHAPADLIREIKKASTSWIRETIDPKFQWQEGYAAFTVSRHDLQSLNTYITNQEEHHRSKSFQEEYIEFLVEQGIVYDERYLW
jgi:putative transposase